MNYPEEYSELRQYPLSGALGQTARMADLWRNVPAQGLVSHVATRAEAATTLEAMERELQCWVARRQMMESQMPAWQN